MEGIIEAVRKCEYDMAAMLILLDHLKQDDLEKLLYFFVYKLIDGKITEQIFIEMIDYINRINIDFTSIKHIKQITELLIDENYSTGSELLTILCDIKNISNDLSKFINNILKSNGILKKKIRSVVPDDPDSKKYNFKIMIKLYNIIHEAEKYIKSFERLAINAHPSNFPNKNDYTLIRGEHYLKSENRISRKYTQNFIIEQFEYYCKEEILNRLILLKNYFEIYFLASINVDIITIDSFIEMKYNDVIKYYFVCSKKIKRSINNHLRLFKNYIRLYEYYCSLISNETQHNDKKN